MGVYCKAPCDYVTNNCVLIGKLTPLAASQLHPAPPASELCQLVSIGEVGAYVLNFIFLFLLVPFPLRVVYLFIYHISL